EHRAHPGNGQEIVTPSGCDALFRKEQQGFHRLRSIPTCHEATGVRRRGRSASCYDSRSVSAPGTSLRPVSRALNWCNLYSVDTGLIVQGPMMNMQILNRLARGAGLLSLAALPVVGFIGPSEAEPRTP